MVKAIKYWILWILICMGVYLLSCLGDISIAAPSPPSQLGLPTGLSMSLAALGDSIILIPVYGKSGAMLAPILSSSSFHDSNLNTRGFALGFYLIPAPGNNVYDIFLSLCAGNDGQGQESASLSHISILGRLDSFKSNVNFSLSPEGVAVPLWIANINAPLMSVNASLVVETKKELQLRDFDGKVVWSVSNVGSMELVEETNSSGNLVIYDSTNRTIMWQSSKQLSDTLLSGKVLKMGMVLTSNDSLYTVRMLPGALVFFSLNTSFPDQAPSPYWAIPVSSTTTHDILDLDVGTAPCPDQSSYLNVTMTDGVPTYHLQPGTCLASASVYISFDYIPRKDRWFFSRLEKDGQLHFYIVSNTSNKVPGPGYALGSSSLQVSGSSISLGAPHSFWGVCNMPLACGPLGFCTPGAHDPCSCSLPRQSKTNVLHANDANDLSHGCHRTDPLPPCNNTSASVGNNNSGSAATTFLELPETSSIFLFSGWNYFNASTPGVGANVSPEKCKESCASACSCIGVFYVMDKSTCFHIKDEFTFLKVIDQSFPNLDERSSTSHISARNYVTYLKVAMGDSESNATSNSSGFKQVNIAIAVSASVLCIAIGMGVYALWCRKSKKRFFQQLTGEGEDMELQGVLPLLPTRFSYQDLHEATQAFSKVLGAGGSGCVYAGELSDGRKVAVKVLESLSTEQSKQFLAEVITIGRTNHHNIVGLVGFCWEQSYHLLVYEFMQRGSLDQWLFDGAANSSERSSTQPLLDWATRFNVVLGILKGLNYLHEECAQPILHFDIKPQNILLDEDFVAKLADFGLSRLMKRDVSEVVTGVRGTPGYIAPEWLLHGSVSKKSDMYSMGMVMLEIVSSRRNVDLELLIEDLSQEKWYFPTRAAKMCDQGSMMGIIDGRLLTLGTGIIKEQVQRMIKAAFWCIQEDPRLRPSAIQVLQWLEGTSFVEDPHYSGIFSLSQPHIALTLSQSRIFSSVMTK